MITLDSIVKTYHLDGQDINILKTVSLDIAQGEFVSIVGKSGSGKSTLLNIIGCLDRFESGKYLLLNQDVSNMTDDQLALIRNTHFGFIFQMFNLIPRNTALSNVEKPLLYRGIDKRTRQKLAREMLERVGLGDRCNHYPSQLSGGQQQRVAIARSLITNPEVIIADEPTGSLDSVTGMEVMHMLRDLQKEGKTIIMVTHDNNNAEYADRIIEIIDGRIV